MMLHSLIIRLQENLPEESQVRDVLDQVFTFLYTLAHWFGELIARVISAILSYELPRDLIDPLGFLIIITLFLFVTEVAKKMAWLVVIVGWVLILLRIVLEITNP